MKSASGVQWKAGDRVKNKPGSALNDSLPSSIYSAHTVTDKDCLLERFSLIRLYLKNIFSFLSQIRSSGALLSRQAPETDARGSSAVRSKLIFNPQPNVKSGLLVVGSEQTNNPMDGITEVKGGFGGK